MSAAQLLNPKAESRVCLPYPPIHNGLLIIYSGEEKLSKSTLMLVRVCKMY